MAKSKSNNDNVIDSVIAEPSNDLSLKFYHMFKKHMETPPALENIIKLCFKIKSNSNGFKNTYEEVGIAKKRAEDSKKLYDEILSLIPLVELKNYGILMQVLNITCVDNCVVYSEALYRIMCDNGKSLGENLRYWDYSNMYTKYEAYMNSVYLAEYNAEIAAMTKKGTAICKKYYREFYGNNIYDMRCGWRERHNYYESPEYADRHPTEIFAHCDWDNKITFSS